MQIPPTAVLQPIARTISSIVFPASPDRATNRKNDRFIAIYSGTSFHCIVLRNPRLRIRYICSVNCEFLCFTHMYISSRHTQKIMQLKSLFGSSRYLDISLQGYITKIVNGLIFFLRNAYKNCPEFELRGQRRD